ncbi:MAG: hypothetical protein SFY95_11660 [Planctomycetota bacterium]|nr:hypothetical protein [Planctomycetota bacterium]
MNDQAHIPVKSLLAVSAVALAAGGPLGAWAVRSLGWPESPVAFEPAMIGAGIVAGVGVLSTLAMSAYAAGMPGRVAQALLAGTTVRILGVLFIGLIATALVERDRAMWMGLLAAGMIGLVLDTLILMKAAGGGATPQTTGGSKDGNA